jgi:hypothetical protein
MLKSLNVIAYTQSRQDCVAGVHISALRRAQTQAQLSRTITRRLF